MSEQPASGPSPSVFNRIVLWFLPAYLIGNFLYRTLTPAHEYPMRTEQVLDMLVDAACIVGLFSLRGKMPSWLFWIAFIAGLALFVIRCNSDASWWTGHLTFRLR